MKLEHTRRLTSASAGLRLRRRSARAVAGLALRSVGAHVKDAVVTNVRAAPLLKGPGDEVLSGSFVTAGQGWYRAEKVGPDSYANQVAAEAEYWFEK